MHEKVIKGSVSKNISLQVILRENADGTVTGECPDIPGCIVKGKNEEDARIKIKAAIEGCLNALLNESFASARVMTAGGSKAGS